MGCVFLFGLSNIHFHKVPSTEGPKGYVSTVCSTPATCPWGSGCKCPGGAWEPCMPPSLSLSSSTDGQLLKVKPAPPWG